MKIAQKGGIGRVLRPRPNIYDLTYDVYSFQLTAGWCTFSRKRHCCACEQNNINAITSNQYLTTQYECDLFVVQLKFTGFYQKRTLKKHKNKNKKKTQHT